MSTPSTLDGIGSHDPEHPCGGRTRLPDEDVNVAPERG